MKVKTVYLIILAAILVAFCVVMFSAFSNITANTSADASDNIPTITDTLRLCGCRVKEIRDEDTAVYGEDADTLREKKVSDLKRRAEITNESENNLLVSIHQNKFQNSAYSGAQVFYSVNDDNSRVLAQSIRSAVVSLLQKDNTRELKPAGSEIYLLDHATVPAVIVECGFLSNSEERARLIDESYQGEMAYSIAMGVLEYIQSQ